MRAYLKGIAVFKSETEKRTIEFFEGLNIVTGLSQTGKSAIYDIVDWCLGSEKFVIPKGVISKFSKLYSILFYIKGVTYLIARKGEFDKHIMYIKTVSNDLKIDDILLSDFKEENFKHKNTVLDELENAFSLLLGNDQTPELNYFQNTKKIGIRSSLSFIYQHQGTIADKFNLFFYQPVKSYFPVLSDWKTQEDFAKEKDLETLKNRVSKIEKEIKEVQNNNAILISNLQNAYYSYLSVIGEEFINEITVDHIIEEIKKFPDKLILKNPDKLSERQRNIEEKLKPLRREKMRLSKERDALLEAQNEGAGLSMWLNSIKKTKIEPNINICPVCKNPSIKLKEIASKIYEAESWLEIELEEIANTEQSFEKEIAKLNIEILAFKEEIDKLQREYEINEDIIRGLQKEQPLEEQAYYAQRNVISEANFLKKKWKKINEIEYATLSDNMERLQNQISIKNKDIAKSYEDAKNEIQGIMNAVVKELYFEHQPPNLEFELNPNNDDKYELFHYDIENDDKMYLNQMGSASNYLACHIGLFVGFLSYFSLRDNSKVPSMLFLDQPSQVYFTSGKELEKDHDVARVKQIYDTLLSWIDFINIEKKFKPQIIVSDHIEHLGKNAEYLKKYFRKNWRDGKGFI